MKSHQFNATLNVLIPRRMTDRSDCETALRALCARETLAPEYFDVVEPIREPFRCNRIDAVIDTIWQWQKGPDTFMWRRRKPKSWGGIYMSKAPEPVHGSISLDGKAGTPELTADLIQLLQDWCGTLGADLGLLDVPPIRPDGTEGCLAVTTWDLRKGLPDLYWGTVFGKPYVDLFGADRLRNAPVARCEQLSSDLYYLQLTDDLDDLCARPTVVAQARQDAKSFLGIDAFIEGGATEPCRRLAEFALMP